MIGIYLLVGILVADIYGHNDEYEFVMIMWPMYIPLVTAKSLIKIGRK